MLKKVGSTLEVAALRRRAVNAAVVADEQMLDEPGTNVIACWSRARRWPRE
jgi:hypothetical protein